MRRNITLSISLFILCVCCLPFTQLKAQGSIASDGGMVTISFDASTTGILNGTYLANGMSTTPASGQLHLNGVHINDEMPGAPDFAATFGAGGSTNINFQGTSNGGIGGGGKYAFDVDPGAGVNRAFGVQPTGSQWGDAPADDGHVVFRFVNNSGVTLTAFRIQYEIYVFNDGPRNTVVEAYLTNNVTTPTYGAIQDSYTTPASADITPTWVNTKSVDFSVTSGVNVPNGQSIYLRLLIFDGPTGSGTRDELAIDDISIIGASTPGGLNPCTDAAPPTITCPGPQQGVLDGNCNFQVIDYTGLATTGDDCGPVTVTQSPLVGQTFNGIGNTVVVLTATDGVGNTATCNMTLSLVDQTLPTITCPSTANRNVNSSCIYSLEDFTGSATTNDNCDASPSVTQSPTAGTNLGVGNQAVTLTVMDASGNSTNCSFTVSVTDNMPPNAVCQDGTVQLDGSGNGSINASALDGGTTDNCPGAISYTPTSFSFTCSNIGPNTVTVSVVDVSFNSTFCTAVVTVQDNMPPTAVCQDATVVLSGTSATLSAGQVDGGSTDNCPPPAVSVSPTMFDCDDVGDNTVTLLVVETSGGTGFSTCTATVTVQDNTPPTASCQSATVQVGETLMPGQVDNGSSDNCTNPPSLSVAPNTFGCGNVGINLVTLTVDDTNGNSATCSTTVNVQSNAPPTAVCANFTANLDGGGNVTIVGSDVDGGSSSVCSTVSLSVTPNTFTCSDIGPNTVTLTATDDTNSQTSTCTAVVTVADPLSACCAGPVAMCNAVTVQLDNLGNGTADPSMVGAGSTADCGLASETVVPSNFDCDDVGPNTVTYTITDINGASSSCTTVVTVEDNVAPVPTCVSATVQLDVNGNGTLVPSAIHGGSMEACGFLPLSASPTSFDCNDVGSVTVTLTVSDVNGNSATCTASVSVEDNVVPVANCQDATVQLDANGDGTLLGTDVDNSSTDACGVASVSVSPASFDCDDLGGNTVTLEVTDNNGNSSTCTATATVEDNVPPTAICLNNTVFLAPDGTYSLQDVDVLDFILSSDNCDNFNVTDIDPSEVDCDDEGQTLSVDVNIEDASGNSGNCTAMISVEQGTALPSPWTAEEIGNSSGTAEFKPCDGEGGKFTLTAKGFSLPNSDVQEFVKQTLCGTNNELIARVCDVTGGGWAGIQMRETTATGSKKVVLKTQLTPIVRRDIRASANGFAQSLNIPRPFQDQWLRLVRQGNFFIGYTSVNGINWQFAFYAFVPMSSCIEVGMYVESINVNTTTTGQFDNVQVNGVPVNPLAAPITGLDIAVEPELERIGDVQLYPNPTSGEAYVDMLPFLGKQVSIEVFNSNGQAVERIEIDRVEIISQRLDLTGQHDGLYLIRIKTPDQPAITRKLMVVAN